MNKPLNKRWWLSSFPSAALIVALVVFILLVIFILWAVFSRQSVIEVQTEGDSGFKGSGKTVCYFVEADFELRWMHSVEKQWWEEQYQRKDDGLLLTTTYFQAFGAGTPSTEALAPIQKPGYLGYQIDEKLPKLNWVVSRLTKGELNYGDQRILIHQWVPDYSEIAITPKAYSLMDRFKKDFCHELPSDGS
ncbi:DUF1850 domain-containing protein [Psychrobacter jeotgali]|uniref:DUF1850 domain-containing protein n=1 Tax=Psychrobacter jeotgali TaxID=179010 RepID=UPI00191B1256|nr:DUF1850 domain-containing protein [Psychrobacter jeotgali]